jgi:hypothetical protein
MRSFVAFGFVLALGFLGAPARAETATVYPWHPTSTEPLSARFPVPPGFARSDAPQGSFGAFLRDLPLLPAGAKVVDWRGRPLYEDGAHPNIAAVVDLDVGTRDLQQCADAIVRLNAEWRYGRGERSLVYKAVSGQPLAYAGWLAGDRAKVSNQLLSFVRSAPPHADDHGAFRSWLDEVFAWAATGSIARDGKPVTREAIVGGDFFVLTGSPFGHAVLVLDVARDASGRLALLLGQSYMPAQSFHVLRPSASSSPWFVVGASEVEVDTPFWRPFPFTSLRRL